MTEREERRVVVQLANGEELPDSSQRSPVSYSETAVTSGIDELSFSSPAAGQLALSSAGGDDTTTTGSGGSRRSLGSIKVTPGGLERIHPPSSPSPPPSMTPPDHSSHMLGHVIHHHQPSVRGSSLRPVGSSKAPAVAAAATDGQQPGQVAIQSDHCYGLAYQDHNYGGVVSGGAPLITSRSGYSGLRIAKPAPRPTTSEDGDGPFPIIGGLASYIAEPDATVEATTSVSTVPPSASASRTSGIMQSRYSRSTVSDGVTVTAHSYRNSSNRESGSGVSYYQRYNPNHSHHYTTSTHTPPYSQSLVTIGGRTYIRQMAQSNAPTSTPTSSLRGRMREYGGTTSTPNSVSTPPTRGSPYFLPAYGSSRRIGSGSGQVLTHKRAGRPRTRATTAGTLTRTPVVTVGAPASAPLVAPSRGGRPAGRGRGGGTIGARRGRTSTTHTAHVVKTPEVRASPKHTFVGDMERRYSEMLNQPLLAQRTPPVVRSPKQAKQLPEKDTVVARVVPGPDVTPGSPMIVTATQNQLPPEQLVGVTPPVLAPQVASPSPMRVAKSPDMMSPVDRPASMGAQTTPELDKTPATEDSESSDSEPSDDSDDDTSSSDDNFVDFDGGDYTTRCLCGLQHNDEYMIECDECHVWQHCRCMGLPSDPKRLPEAYICERCSPRPLKLTVEQARQFQQKKLARWAKEKERRRIQRMKRKEHKIKERLKRREDRRRIRKQAANKIAKERRAMDTWAEISENEYTTDAKKFIAAQGDTYGQDLLSQLSETLCDCMFVAAGKQGLVATHLIPPNQPVAEFRGRVCLKSECNGRDKMGRQLPHVLLYSGFTVATGVDMGTSTLCVDARHKGSKARWVRRSCRPNTQVKHVITGSLLHLLLLSTELIERGTEVTAPFDFDFRSSKYPLECACGATTPIPEEQENAEMDPCPIAEFNRELAAKKAQVAKERQQARKRQTDAKKRVAAAKRKQTNSENRKKAEEKAAKLEKSQKSKAVKNAAKLVTARAVAKKKAKIKLKLMPKRKIGPRAKPAPATRRGRHSIAAAAKSASPAPIKIESPRSKSVEEEAKKKTNMLNQLRDYWNNDIDTKDNVKTETVDWTLPDERHKPMSREDRKLQMQIAQIEKKEAEKKKKEERVRVKSESGDDTKKPSPVAKGKRGPSKDTKQQKRKGKWSKGQDKKQTKKQKKKPTKPKRRVSKRTSKSEEGSSSSELSSDNEDDDQSGPSPGTSGGGRSRQPPRKRWTSTHNSPANKSNESASSVSASPGGKKRWLRQAMSEESGTPSQNASSPLKKRRLPDSARADSLTTAEAAELLTQMGQQPGVDATPASPVPDGETDQQPTIIPMEAVDELGSEAFGDMPSLADIAPVRAGRRERKKLSLDDYKRRKGDKPEGAPTSSRATRQSTAAGFMPEMTESQLLESGRHRLSSLPDPSQIGKGTATLDDLKQRIYGTRSTTHNEDIPPPPPPKPRAPAEQHRMSLDDRLRTEFGVDDACCF